MAEEVIPVFIPSDLEEMYNVLVDDYEGRTLKQLSPAQPEALVLRTFAYQLHLLKQQFNNALLQMLVPYSKAPVLDYLAQLVGVTRLASSSSNCTLRFIMTDGHAPNITIPIGTRVASSDSLAIFETLDEVIVAGGVNTVDISAECQTVGVSGNGYIIGSIKNILDPVAGVFSASNIDVTAGGSELETDEQLRDRIILAPNSFSVAGPSDAYKFFAKSANSSIVDVAVTTPVAGTVKVFPLISPAGVTPLQVLEDVLAVLSDEKIRPLCDTVLVESPIIRFYTLTIGITKFETGVSDKIIEEVTERVTAYLQNRERTLGGNLVVQAIIAASMVEGVYSVAISGTASSDINCEDNEVAVLSGVLGVNVVSIKDGER